MRESELVSVYRRYIDCLNDRNLDRLGEFVDQDVEYNGDRIGLMGYRAMLEGNYRDIPDLRFAIQLVVAGASSVAARLNFDCTPAGRFLGLDVGGRRVAFSENVFYEYRDGRIRQVWSVIDKVAIQAQLRGAGAQA
ncbi:ester cyclase [Xanthomonas sp. AmX2]|uniref:ester cyclase n=1 Tax=Xanthomonas sp. TaxID=29446 RepID=UPI00197E3CF4|nr:ester cyclase [Xanthomonas sp.]MBN6151572.1 ester cyclase [Xanthomonas sp.]